MGVVESVKAASDVYAPVSGEIVEVSFAFSHSMGSHPAISNATEMVRNYCCLPSRACPSRRHQVFRNGLKNDTRTATCQFMTPLYASLADQRGAA